MQVDVVHKENEVQSTWTIVKEAVEDPILADEWENVLRQVEFEVSYMTPPRLTSKNIFFNCGLGICVISWCY